MRSVESREDTTVTIATTVFLFVGLLGAGAAVAYALRRIDPIRGVVPAVLIATLVVASGVSLRYLVRHRHPG